MQCLGCLLQYSQMHKKLSAAGVLTTDARLCAPTLRADTDMCGSLARQYDQPVLTCISSCCSVCYVGVFGLTRLGSKTAATVGRIQNSIWGSRPVVVCTAVISQRDKAKGVWCRSVKAYLRQGDTGLLFRRAQLCNELRTLQKGRRLTIQACR